MSLLPHLGLVVLHTGATVLLAGFAWHRLSLAVRYVRIARRRRTPPRRPALSWPTVTVQVPLYNERHVAARAIRAAASLRYPARRLDIQILDDSTDGTSEIVARTIARLPADVPIHHVRRSAREGFKAGALANGLREARGELLAIFDADFVPHPDFLERIVPDFHDPQVGMVQARWSHLNAGRSVLTQCQALNLDAHFTVEHQVRATTGCLFNFNGTAGVWRKSAIQAAGGWRANTLTEDLDLSYRAQLAGWRFVYRDDVDVPAELPSDFGGYRRQQQRWAQGGLETARLLLGGVWRADLPPRAKLEATWQLLGNLAYPLLMVVGVTGIVLSLLPSRDTVGLVRGMNAALLLFALLSLGGFYGAAILGRGGLPTAWRLTLLPAVMLLGGGIAWPQTVAAWRAVTGQRTEFLRTPKYRDRGTGRSPWRRSQYWRPNTRLALIECIVGLALTGMGLAAAVRAGVLPVGVSLFVGPGLAAVAMGSLAQSLLAPLSPLTTGKTLRRVARFSSKELRA